jgi:hypothetical protein
LIIFKTRCERLEKTNFTLNQEIDKEFTRTKKLRDMLDKQRELCYKLCNDFYKEKIKSISLSNEVIQYQTLYNTLKTSQIELYPIIMAKTKIHSSSLIEQDDL